MLPTTVQDPSSLPFKLNVAAAVLFPSIIPFTLVFIVPTNNKLEAKMRDLAATSLEDLQCEVAPTGRGVPKNKPGNDFLLGFEAEKEEALPLKTYIRRLWLAFQSSKRQLPKYFFDPKAEDFSKEIDAWVSDYVNNPDMLAAERAKCHVLLPSLDNNPERIHSAFLEEIARTILITRE
ncbi:hypothetical protein EJ07DRAFT_182890 [Lizonia empirigonia]|nr:hypothetical protein EJ07DRAFT_182890 [Lizonia empirigonia]